MPASPQQMMPVILQRLAGSLTAAQAAQRLGISRKTYYQWEARALRGMHSALCPGQAGRPPSTRDGPLAQMQAQNQQLQQQVLLLEQRWRVWKTMAGGKDRAKKK